MSGPNKSPVTPAKDYKIETNFGTKLKSTVQILAEVYLLVLKIFLACLESLYRFVWPLEPKSVIGKNVLITGTGHGIGRELALHYASEGATVIGWDVNQKGNEETMKIIKERSYPKAHFYCCDVSNRQEVMRVAKEVQEEVGFVSILINNAGVLTSRKILDQNQGEIERLLNINVLAHFWLIQAFLPDMKKRNEGHIVALSSCAGLLGVSNIGPYSASKFAVRGLMEALLEELTEEKSDVKLTIIYPFFTNTGMAKKPKSRFESCLPLLDPKDVAKIVANSQRTDQCEVSIPGYALFLINLGRLLPIQGGLLLKSFLGTGIDPDP